VTDRTSAGRFLAEQPRDSRFLLTIVRDVALAALADEPTPTRTRIELFDVVWWMHFSPRRAGGRSFASAASVAASLLSVHGSATARSSLGVA
jgi:hypothetical protein